MKGINTWQKNLLEAKSLTKRQLNGVGLSLLRNVLGKVAENHEGAVSQVARSVRLLLPESRGLTAEEQILAAKRNLLLLMFLTVTLLVLYTLAIIQVIK